MAKRLVPWFSRVVVKVETMQASVQEKYASLAKVGFQIPKSLEDKLIPDEGTIIAVGASCEHAAVGQRILFGKWAAKEIGFQPGLFVMMEEDVIGLIEDDGLVAVAKAKVA